MYHSWHYQRRPINTRGQGKYHQQGSIYSNGRETQSHLLGSQGLQSYQLVSLCLRGTLLETHLDTHQGVHIEQGPTHSDKGVGEVGFILKVVTYYFNIEIEFNRGCISY